jgi:hypothetical protein
MQNYFRVGKILTETARQIFLGPGNSVSVIYFRIDLDMIKPATVLNLD